MSFQFSGLGSSSSTHHIPFLIIISVRSLKMKIAIAVLLALVAAATTQENTPRLRTEQKDYGDGTFHTIIERYDGSRVYQAGWVKNPEEEDIEKRQQIMVGFFGHTANGGAKYNTTYLSNEYGYQVDGAHLNEAQQLPEYVYNIVNNIREGRGIGYPVEELRQY